MDLESCVMISAKHVKSLILLRYLPNVLIWQKKFADEVSADWLGLDIKPADVESVKTACENVEASNDKSEEEHDDLPISGVSNDKSENVEALNDKSVEEHDDSESTNSNDASNQGSEEKPLSEVCMSHCGGTSVIPGEPKYAVPEVCGCHRGNSSIIPGDKPDNIKAEADSLIFLPVTVKSVDQTALVEVSKSHEGSSTVGPSDKTVDTSFVEVSKSHEGNSVLGLSNKTVETADESDNLANFSKPIEFGDFEDVDLKDDWEDDTDYDLDVVSYYESKKKSSKKKLAAKFISKLRGSMKSRSVEVAHKPDAKSTDSDWEFL